MQFNYLLIYIGPMYVAWVSLIYMKSLMQDYFSYVFIPIKTLKYNIRYDTNLF